MRQWNLPWYWWCGYLKLDILCTIRKCVHPLCGDVRISRCQKNNAQVWFRPTNARRIGRFPMLERVGFPKMMEHINSLSKNDCGTPDIRCATVVSGQCPSAHQRHIARKYLPVAIDELNIELVHIHTRRCFLPGGRTVPALLHRVGLVVEVLQNEISPTVKNA